ncbi:MAG: hypothetical protein II653_00200 [Lachnospiraceae bacterium]|jgi:hypothetical protein|nr:hypothetical protein [Lachnospiraceae bacterium]
MGKYDDIINMPHYQSKKHPQMSIYMRAAQFSPFAALTGFEEQTEETARLTDERIELDENKRAELDEKLNELMSYDNLMDVQVRITYFEEDLLKSGGKYREVHVNIKKIDAINRCIVLDDRSKILIDDIYDIDF